MGKNARRRKEAKLQKLKQSASSSDCCNHEGHCHHRDAVEPSVNVLASIPPVFRTEKHEAITEELVRELVGKQGWEEKGIRECQNMGMSYCRERNSFVSPPEAFGSFN